jgi:hypothetical protein
MVMATRRAVSEAMIGVPPSGWWETTVRKEPAAGARKVVSTSDLD